MLLRFGCSNYKSINEYQELVMTATSLADTQMEPIDFPEGKIKALPVIAIYGANASGKTNIIEAMKFACDFVLDSYKGNTKGVERSYFKLDKNSKQRPSEFDCDVVINGRHYNYGFSLDDETVLEEWLFEFNYGQRKSRRTLFYRNRSHENEFSFGSHLKGKNKDIADLTRDNCLFLSSGAQNKHPLLTEIYDAFDNTIFKFGHFPALQSLLNSLEDEDNLEFVSSFLTFADTGIEQINFRKEALTEEQKAIFNKVSGALNQLTKSDDDVDDELFQTLFGDGEEQASLEFVHKSCEQNTSLALEEQSLGTRNLIPTLLFTKHVLDSGSILVVDELNDSLHPLLVIELLKLFKDSKSNPNGAQLILTTHETSILTSNILRRDQVWLAEKSKEGESYFTPLSDFKLRSNDNIAKGYLEGRFGAIPFFGDIKGIYKGNAE